MVAILGILARLSIILGFVGAIFASISDLFLNTNYLNQLESFVNLEDQKVKIILLLVSVLYLIIFLLSAISRITKYSQNRKVKNKSGDIVVNIKTINETAKEFLDREVIVKNSRVKSSPKGSSVVVEAVVDTYNVDSLSEKLGKIQERLADYLLETTGITMSKKSKIKLRRVLSETVIEKREVEEVAENVVVQEVQNQNENVQEIENTVQEQVENQVQDQQIENNQEYVDTQIDEIVNENINQNVSEKKEKKSRKWF